MAAFTQKRFNAQQSPVMPAEYSSQPRGKCSAESPGPAAEVTDNGDASNRSVHVGRSNSLVETAKDRLVQFRRRHERLSEAQSDAIRVMLKGPDGDVHCAKAFGVDGSWITA